MAALLAEAGAGEKGVKGEGGGGGIYLARYSTGEEVAGGVAAGR